MEQLSVFDINFPVYGITSNHIRIWTEFNILKIETDSGIYILDNKNLDGDTVGKRRVKITKDLYIPRKVYYTIPQFLHSKYNYFLDNTGRVFKYIKTKFVPLIYYKVKDVYVSEDGECIISFFKTNFTYKTNCRFAYAVNYIGILETKMGQIPYEFSEDKKNNTRRKI